MLKIKSLLILIFLSLAAFALLNAQTEEELKKLEEAGFESNPENINKVITGGVPGGRWDEGLMFEGIEPMPWLKSAANWFPNTEDVQPDEIRIIFMGSSPTIRPGQMNTSVFVQLGNGKNFVFDIGEGAVSNFIAAGIALNEINNIFISHLHVDHFGSLPYVYAFGAWAGRWHEPLPGFLVLPAEQKKMEFHI